MVKSEYHYGRRKELEVAKHLRRRGYKVKVHKGSKGASDIEAVKGSKKWVVQVKATTKKRSTRISPNERRRLKIQARKRAAVPVHAEVIRGKIVYKSVRTGRKLRP